MPRTAAERTRASMHDATELAPRRGSQNVARGDTVLRGEAERQARHPRPLRSRCRRRSLQAGRHKRIPVKARELIYLLLGLKPKPETFGFVIDTHDLPGEGRGEGAPWLAPRAPPGAP